MNDPPFELNLAGIGGVHSGQDFPERAFARAVFAEQSVTTAAFDGEADVIERVDAGETLRDMMNSRKGMRFTVGSWNVCSAEWHSAVSPVGNRPGAVHFGVRNLEWRVEKPDAV